jgi:tetratricopeptide (TPR) repeat protein
VSAGAPVRRNDPCPCGSGRRYKECHGRLEGAPAPDDAALVARALGLHRQGRVEEAERIYRDVLSRDPGHPVATHYLGMAAWQRGDAREGERLMRAALAANATVPDFHNNLALLLRDTKRTSEAIAGFRRALEVDPGWFEASNNLGLALEDTGAWDDAIVAYRAAIAREPRFAAARQNLARVLLALGRYAEGWEEYRWRLVAQGLSSAPPDPNAPRFPESLTGRRIALAAEQGLGDVLFFLRFAPELARRGAALAFRGDERLRPLLAPTGLFQDAFDESIFIGDLPWLLDAGHEGAFPPALPLRPDETRAARMHERLAALGSAPRIALTWRAGVASVGPVRSQLKEIPLDALGQALKGIAATWIGIQRLPRAGEREALSQAIGARIHDFSDANDDLQEMLALLALVDDYVGVSNANAHLRASLGRPMQVLIPFPPEWRWGAAGTRSPWFPSMTALRQEPGGDWSRALRALRSYIAGRTFAGSTGLP